MTACKIGAVTAILLIGILTNSVSAEFESDKEFTDGEKVPVFVGNVSDGMKDYIATPSKEKQVISLKDSNIPI